MLHNESGIVEVMTRTLQGRYLLRPSPRVNDLILGIVGRAQALYDVEIYAFVFLSNHLHMLMRVLSVWHLSRFMEYVDGNIAREVGAANDWSGKFWGGRYHSVIVGDSDEAILDRFRYILANGCKEGLVASPLDWPGVTSARALARGEDTLEGTWYDRTAEYYASARGAQNRSFPSSERVRLTPLPFLANHSPAERARFVQNEIREIEQQSASRHKRLGTRPLGARAIRRQQPHDKPKDFHPSPAPRFHAATREELWSMRYAREVKVAAYRDAAERLKRGETDVRFPEGCFPPPLPFVESRAPT